MQDQNAENNMFSKPAELPEQASSVQEEGEMPPVDDVSPAAAPPEKRTKGRIGDQLMARGLISPEQLNVALQEKKTSGKMLGRILVDLEFISESVLSEFLSQSSGVEQFSSKGTIVDNETASLISKELARQYKVLPFSQTDQNVMVAMADPYDVVALDMLRRHMPKNLKVQPFVAPEQTVLDTIDATYGYASRVKDILAELENEDPENLKDLTQLSEEESYSHPLVRLVNALIVDAVKEGVSDLHFEPEENFVRLRNRRDGVLHTEQVLHRKHWRGLAQRLKLMADLNIADKLTPQDGRIRMSVGGRIVNFRVSSLPTVYGENIVLRVLDKKSAIMPLAGLGFSDSNKAKIDRAQRRPEGIIIVTGPTGSGKSTTLYSMLNEINTVDVNIQTLEDPVEYTLPMIRQTAVREGVLEFADGIRAMLRQDPDIIFIGEIRDKITAEMALQAAMTGHQVYTTLHTNDSFGAIPRLLDMGMVPGMLAGNIIAVFAQRLTRLLCNNCKEMVKPTQQELEALNASSEPDIFKARQGGCEECEGRGYRGRTALAEVLLFDDELDEAVAKGETRADIKRLALQKDFKGIREDAALKIMEGRTSFEAVSKVVDMFKT